jgi:hypothetical protein
LRRPAPAGLASWLIGWLLAVPTAAQTLFRDDFSSPSLDATRWVITAAGDFRERTVELTSDHWLRVRAGTIGTRDDTVKFLGVRTREAFAVGEGLCVAATLDWNDQANGSYLSAAVVLAGAPALENPLLGRDWLAAEYIGVPPGHNVRLELTSSAAGRRRTLEDEGWPEQREGRRIGTVRVVLFAAPASTLLWENGERRHQSTAPGLSAKRVFLHLQLSSHSNYPVREVYFDDVEVSAADAEECGRRARPPDPYGAFYGAPLAVAPAAGRGCGAALAFASAAWAGRAVTTGRAGLTQ